MKVLVVSLVCLAAVAGCKHQVQPATQPVSSSPNSPAGTGELFTPEELRAFTALDPIDTHTHVRRTDPQFNAMLDRLNLHLLDIILVDDKDAEENNLELEKKQANDFIRSTRGRAVLCTSIDPYRMHDPGFAASAIKQLNDDFAHGAIAVKIWKNLGMEIRDDKGGYVLPDDPALIPIYRDIAQHNRTLVAHVADPDSAWQPPNPASPDYSYYKEHPEWYMYGKSDRPSKQQILLARDHIMDQVPNLRLVGAHLGSMEADLDQLAQHLDHYPHFAVDMAARMPYFALQPRDRMIAFILKYQDRLIYGTDLAFSARSNPENQIRAWERTYARDWRFLAMDQQVSFNGAQGKGLALPAEVLRKIYHDNAARWFPGILTATH